MSENYNKQIIYQTEDSVINFGHRQDIRNGGKEPQDDSKQHDSTEDIKYNFMHWNLIVVGFNDIFQGF